MVVVGSDDRMQVNEAREVAIDLRSILRMSVGKFSKAACFVGLVVDEYWARAVRRDCFEHALDARDRRIVAAKIQKLDVLEDSWGAFNVARPLERDLFVGVNARPAWDR